MAASLIPEIESVKLAVSNQKQSLLEASGRRFHYPSHANMGVVQQHHTPSNELTDVMHKGM